MSALSWGTQPLIGVLSARQSHHFQHFQPVPTNEDIVGNGQNGLPGRRRRHGAPGNG